MEKPSVKFNYGDNIYMLIIQMKKVLDENEFGIFQLDIDENADNYDETIEIAEKYVDIV